MDEGFLKNIEYIELKPKELDESKTHNEILVDGEKGADNDTDQ